MMVVYRYSAGTQESATYRRVAHNIHGQKLLKDVYCTVILGRQHRYHTVKMLGDEDLVSFSAMLLRMPYAFPVDGMAILPAQPVKTSKISKFSTATV